MGIDAIPLRTQPDRRLVRLVREGYESAFEEIVRRYRRPLDRFAASIVGGRSEDVTQDSFRKALEALRRDDAEIELRPWLYRIVRNTALNDLRDHPPAAAELADDLMAGGRSAASVAEQRAEIAALTAKLRALPEKQRAALVMRELEGMGHEEIASALGISGGAARQAIARGRAAVRGGFGALIPLPLLRALAGSGDAATDLATGTGGVAAGGAGAALLGGGAALKVGIATVVVAGGIGAGVAVDHERGTPVADPPRAAAQAQAPSPAPGRPAVDRIQTPPTPVLADNDDPHPDGHRHGDRHHGSDPGGGLGSGDERESGIEAEVEVERSAVAVPEFVDDRGPMPSGNSGGGPGPSRSDGDHGASGRSGDDRSGSGSSGSSSGGHRSGGDDASHSGPDGGNSGSGDDSGSSGSGSGGGHGSDDLTEAVAEAPAPEALPTQLPASDFSSSNGPGPSSSTPSSGDDDSGSSGGHGSDDELEISP